MKKIFYLLCTCVISQLLFGCGALYPMKKENLLNGQVISLRSELPTTDTLTKTKEEFKSDILEDVDAWMIDDIAKKYADNVIDGYLSKDNKQLTIKSEDVIDDKAILRFLNFSIQQKLGAAKKKIVYQKIFMAPKFDSYDMSPINIETVTSTAENNNKQIDGISRASVASNIEYKALTEYFKFDSIAEIYFKYRIAIQPQTFDVTINDVNYAIYSHEGAKEKRIWSRSELVGNTLYITGGDYFAKTSSQNSTVKAMLINDEKLLEELKSLKLDFKGYVESKLEKRYDKTVQNAIHEIKKNLNGRFVYSNKENKIEKLYHIDYVTAKSRLQRSNEYFKPDSEKEKFSHVEENDFIFGKLNGQIYTAKQVYSIALYPDKNDTAVIITGNCVPIHDNLTGKDVFDAAIKSQQNEIVSKLAELFR